MKLGAILIGLAFFCLAPFAFAFVVLDTSTEAIKNSEVLPNRMNFDSGHSVLPSFPKTENAFLPAPHYGNVLFLSTDDELVYAYLGVLKALEKYGLHIDLIVAESKATLIATAWALNYSMPDIETFFLQDSLSQLFGGANANFYPDVKDGNLNDRSPLQWKINLNLQKYFAGLNQEKSQNEFSQKEFLPLAWTIAKLTHDAPLGPVEDLAATPKPFMVQVMDLESGEIKIISEGSLQNVLKGSLLPLSQIHHRPNLSTFASSELITANQLATQNIPFTFDRLLVIEPTRNLQPKRLSENNSPWTDSLQKNQIRNSFSMLQKKIDPQKISKIELVPEENFNTTKNGPEKWIELGYISTLRSIDYLRTVLPGKVDTLLAPGAIPTPVVHANLGLGRVSVNPLASGGRQMILDLIKRSEDNFTTEVGLGSLDAILKSGFYSDIDLEWTRAIGEENASIIIDAKEKSRIQFEAGWNAALTQADIPDRPPEIFGRVEWSEPFYLPFHSEVGALLGGPTPGYQARIMISPIYPIRLDLGVSTQHWEISYPFVTAIPKIYHAENFPLKQTLTQLFFKVYPTSGCYLKTSIQKHAMENPMEKDPFESDFISTDFEEEAFLSVGNLDHAKSIHNFAKLRYRNLNRDNLFGPVKFSLSNFESILHLGWNDLSVEDQYYWSNQSLLGATSFDFMETGVIQVFDFQDEYFLEAFRATNFQELHITYAPSFGNAGLKASVGRFQLYGAKNYFLDQIQNPIHEHWEWEACYQTPWGHFRGGMASLWNQSPLYFIRFGADLDLNFDH